MGIRRGSRRFDLEDIENVGELYPEAAAQNTNDPAKDRRRHRILRELIASAVILAAIGAMLAFTHKAYAGAEREREENYWSKVTRQSDGTILVRGKCGDAEYQYVEDGRILEGVTVGGVSLGGMNYEEARAALVEEIDRRIENLSISTTVDGTTVLINAADVKVTSTRDIGELIGSALMVGRGEDRDYYQNYLERQRIAKEGVDLGDFGLMLDEDSVSAVAERIASIVDKTPEEPYITLRSRVGGTKPGVGVGGDESDIFTTKTVYAPDGKAMADIQFHNGKNGYVIDRQNLADQIKNAFDSGDYSADLHLELVETEPQMTAEELSESIVELSRFSTNFRSSDTARARNVQKAAGLLHCTIMEPGVNYSYNDILGPRYESDGWLPAHAIAGGREYIDSPGGGICQVSTTLYNALLKNGDRFKIVRRFHHSIPGGYIAMGLDATVSYGGPDLVWRNEGDTPALLFSYADMNTRTVYEIIYGVADPDGYTYRVWSETVETIAPPEPLRVEEKLWPTGYSKMVITPRTGYNVNVYRQKYDRNGQTVGEPVMLYQDKYAAVRGELHYGTGPSYLPRPE